jgi:hypothetical protein
MAFNATISGRGIMMQIDFAEHVTRADRQRVLGVLGSCNPTVESWTNHIRFMFPDAILKVV